MASKRNEADVENGSTSDVLFKEGGAAGTDNFGSSFSDKVIRARFIRKVYAILLSQLAVTLVIVCACVFSYDIKKIYCDELITDENGLYRCTRIDPMGKVIYWASYVVFFVTYMTLVCCEGVRRKSPGNLIALGIFTLALSLMVGSISVYHNAAWVFMAIGITALICLGLTIFSFQTKIDITGWGMYLFAGSWILFLFGIIAIIFSINGYPIMYTVYSGLMALLFSMFLVYDTQQIMGGKKYSISPEEHIYAAVQLYVDVIMIFLSILNLGRGN